MANSTKYLCGKERKEEFFMQKVLLNFIDNMDQAFFS